MVPGGPANAAGGFPAALASASALARHTPRSAEPPSDERLPSPKSSLPLVGGRRLSAMMRAQRLSCRPSGRLRESSVLPQILLPAAVSTAGAGRLILALQRPEGGSTEREGGGATKLMAMTPSVASVLARNLGGLAAGLLQTSRVAGCSLLLVRVTALRSRRPDGGA